MATVTVVNDNIGGHLEVYYSFSANVSARTWSLYSELRLVVPSGATYGAWIATGAHDGNLVGNGISSLGAGTHTLDSYSTSGHYNSNGDAPSVNISWAFNVRSSWAGYWDNYGSITATGSPIGPDGTPPTGLTTTLGNVGPNWAEITVNISSYGSPSTSASRYIEAAILGSSTYGNPYRYKKQTAVTSNTFTVDNSGSGSLTIAPNTQYHYGGYATNTVRSTSTVTGTFVTLPAKPTLIAVDQGHGQIDFTVSHATEGSAKTVTEEYSTDGGTTWTTITGGAFTLTLATQTEVIVRRISDAGESSETVTVTPTFTNGIYASVSGQSERIKKIYLPINGVSKKVKKVYASVNGESTLVFEDIS